MNVFELFGKIAIDSSGAEKGINDTVKQVKKAEGRLERSFKKIGGMVAAAFSVRAVVDFGRRCTEVYASIAAEESAFAQIMGEYADTAQEKLNAVSDATGITATRMTGHMTSLTAKFKGLGYDVEDATTLATDGLLIAADAAAFWDKSLEETVSHLNSFINGSYEGGEAIGLFANDTQMAAYAIEQGIVKDTKAWAELDEATKQATRLDYAKNMMEQAGATGQAAKEADAYANVKANLTEKWRQFQGVIGKPVLEKIVLPAMQKMLDFMPTLIAATEETIGIVSAWFTNFVSWMQTGGTEVELFKAAIIGVVTAFLVWKSAMAAKTVFDAFVSSIELIKTAFTALNTVMSANPIALVTSLISGLVAAFMYLWNTSEEFRAFWIDVWEWICTAVSDAVDGIKGFIDDIVSGWNSITSAIDGAIASVKEFLGLDSAAPEYNPGNYRSNPANVLGTGTVSTGGVMGAQAYAFGYDSALNDKIPGFATGLDYVPRDNYLARLHQGEAVLTRNEADAWRGGTGKVEAVLAQMADLLRDIARNTGAETNVVLETGALVGALTPRINQQLGNLNRLNARG